jgi:hypothetical protein
MRTERISRWESRLPRDLVRVALFLFLQSPYNLKIQDTQAAATIAGEERKNFMREGGGRLEPKGRETALAGATKVPAN